MKSRDSELPIFLTEEKKEKLIFVASTYPFDFAKAPHPETLTLAEARHEGKVLLDQLFKVLSKD